MANISDDDVRYLAQLSNVALTDEQIAPMAHDLAAILAHVDTLSQLDTSGVEPTYQVGEMQNVWRDDKIDNHQVTREQLLALAPEQQDGQIKVPKVLDR